MVQAERSMTRSMTRRWLSPRALMLVIAGALTVVVSVTPAHAGISVKRNDYNRDGISDLVAIEFWSGCLYRWNGNGSGGFGGSTQVGCGWQPYWGRYAAVGDINRDGNGDLVAIQNDTLHRWFGTGSGGFAYGGTWGGGWDAYLQPVGVGDISGDGVGDLIAFGGDGAGGRILHRWFGNGSGGFTYAGSWGGGWSNYDDLTGMGNIGGGSAGDLVARRTDSALLRWTGNGNGGFNAGQLVLGFFTLSNDPE
jgi:hypothetical protein